MTRQDSRMIVSTEHKDGKRRLCPMKCGMLSSMCMCTCAFIHGIFFCWTASWQNKQTVRVTAYCRIGIERGGKGNGIACLFHIVFVLFFFFCKLRSDHEVELYIKETQRQIDNLSLTIDHSSRPFKGLDWLGRCRTRLWFLNIFC